MRRDVRCNRITTCITVRIAWSNLGESVQKGIRQFDDGTACCIL